MNFTDILGSVLNQGMTPSSDQRINNSLSPQGSGGGIGDLLNQLGGAGGSGAAGGSSGGSSGGGLGDLLSSLGKMAGAAINSGPSGGSNPMVSGGLGALVGALFGGGSGSVKGALGGTALAVIGSLAMKALANRGQPDSSAQLMAGLRAPQNDAESREVQDIAELIVRAMLNAAKADGQVDREEIRKIVGKASEDGLSQQEQDFIRAEIGKPMETESLVRAASNPQLAAQVYTASLLAIEVDTDAERRYLTGLAADLGLDRSVVSQLHGALGVA